MSRIGDYMDGLLTIREAARGRKPLDGTDAQALEGALAMTERERDGAIAAKDAAYRERNLCVALIARLALDNSPSEETPNAWLGIHPPEDTTWEADWRNIVFVEVLGVGQLSWHIHDSELHLFDFLPVMPRRKWDGHTTEEKYARLRAALRNKARTEGGAR